MRRQFLIMQEGAIIFLHRNEISQSLEDSTHKSASLASLNDSLMINGDSNYSQYEALHTLKVCHLD